eukprot:GILI01017891.1.p1 GENE.GILI01017891.1~~GILI01017891.1.p1  ORF type:complete len:215 (+),score=17.69 GILI01017891.1:99-647(+)
MTRNDSGPSPSASESSSSFSMSSSSIPASSPLPVASHGPATFASMYTDQDIRDLVRLLRQAHSSSSQNGTNSFSAVYSSTNLTAPPISSSFSERESVFTNRYRRRIAERSEARRRRDPHSSLRGILRVLYILFIVLLFAPLVLLPFAQAFSHLYMSLTQYFASFIGHFHLEDNDSFVDSWNQ